MIDDDEEEGRSWFQSHAEVIRTIATVLTTLATLYLLGVQWGMW